MKLSVIFFIVTGTPWFSPVYKSGIISSVIIVIVQPLALIGENIPSLSVVIITGKRNDNLISVDSLSSLFVNN
jgi:hypothetical protein